MPRPESRRWLSSTRSKEKGSPGRSTISRSTAVARVRVEPGEHHVLDDRARAGLDHQAHAAPRPGPRRSVTSGAHAGVEVAGAPPGGEQRVAAPGHVAQAVGEPGPQRAAPAGPSRRRTAAGAGPRPRPTRDHGSRAGAREEDDGEAASALRHLGLDARLEVPALLEARDEAARVLLEGRVVERAARLRAQAREEQRVGVAQLHGARRRRAARAAAS